MERSSKVREEKLKENKENEFEGWSGEITCIKFEKH